MALTIAAGTGTGAVPSAPMQIIPVTVTLTAETYVAGGMDLTTLIAADATLANKTIRGGVAVFSDTMDSAGFWDNANSKLQLKVISTGAEASGSLTETHTVLLFVE